MARPRSAGDFDDEAIGLLTVPPPDLGDLGRDLSLLYEWLGDLDDDERAVAEGRPQDRNLVLRLLGQLPGGRDWYRPLTRIQSQPHGLPLSTRWRVTPSRRHECRPPGSAIGDRNYAQG